MQMGYIPGVQAPQRLALSTLPQPPGPGFVWGCQKKGDGTGGVPTAPTAASSHAPHTQQLTLIPFILFFPSMGQWSPVHSNRTQVSSSPQQSWGLPATPVDSWTALPTPAPRGTRVPPNPSPTGDRAARATSGNGPLCSPPGLSASLH